MTVMPCQLKCFFCLAGNDYEVPRHIFTVEKFKELIDMLLAHGFDQVDLTPVVGDLFQDKGIYEKFAYMHEKKLFFEYVSNILSLKADKIPEILSYPKQEFAISIYGWDDESYKAVTKTNHFKLFLKNLKLIQAVPGCKENLRIYLRNRDWPDIPDSEVKTILQDLYARGATLEDAELTNKNWGSRLKYGPEQKNKGMCNRFLFENGIYPNGDITLCNCWDWDKYFIIGNIYEQTLEEIYDLDKNEKLHTFVKNQIMSKYEGPCLTCNDFYQTDQTWGYDWIGRYKVLFEKGKLRGVENQQV
jgi:sulfatase maturation enzyme AslB (radical SAM superfamily)